MRSHSDIYLARWRWTWHQRLIRTVAKAIELRPVTYSRDASGNLIRVGDVLTPSERALLDASAARVAQARHAYETAKISLKDSLTT